MCKGFPNLGLGGVFSANGGRAVKKNPDHRSGFSCLKKKMRKTVFVTWLFFSKSCRASGILGADDPFGDVSKSISLFSVFLFRRFSVFAFAKLFHLSKEDNFSQSQQSCR